MAGPIYGHPIHMYVCSYPIYTYTQNGTQHPDMYIKHPYPKDTEPCKFATPYLQATPLTPRRQPANKTHILQKEAPKTPRETGGTSHSLEVVDVDAEDTKRRSAEASLRFSADGGPFQRRSPGPNQSHGLSDGTKGWRFWTLKNQSQVGFFINKQCVGQHQGSFGQGERAVASWGVLVGGLHRVLFPSLWVLEG